MPASRPVPANESARFAALHDSLLLDRAPAMPDLVQLAASACHAPIAFLSLVATDTIHLLHAVGLEITQLARAGSFCEYTILGDELLVVPDALVDLRVASCELVTGAARARFYAGVPLVTADGLALGTLAIVDRTPRELAAAERLTLRALGRAATAELELAIARGERRRSLMPIEVATLWNALPVGACVVETTGRVARANDQLLRLLDMTPAELEGCELASLVGGDAARALLDGAALPEAGVRARIAHKSGEVVDVILQRRPGPREPLVVCFTVDRGGAVDPVTAAATSHAVPAYEVALRETTAKTMFDAALDAAQMGAWQRDVATGLMMFSGPAARLLGVEPSRLPRSFNDLFELVLPEDLPDLEREVRRASRDRDGLHAKFRVLRDGQPRWISAHGAFAYDDAGVPIRSAGVFSDVTAVVRADDELRALNRQIQSILESIADGFVALDRNWHYIYVNRRAAEMFGRDAKDLIGKHIWTEFPEGVGQPFHRAYERAMTEQVPVSFEAYYEPWGRWFENRIYPSPTGVTIFFTEMTERKRTEDELRSSRDRLRALSARLHLAREQEAARIATEIHDDLGQALTALKLDTSWLQRRLEALPPDPEARAASDAAASKRLSEMIGLLDAALSSVQRVATELRPSVLDELGLGEALRWYGDQFHKRTQVHYEFHEHVSDLETTRDTATAIFRIFQEALTNIARHSGAHRVDVTLDRNYGELVLTIEDDGKGIDPKTISAPRSIGLLGMQERATAIDGSVAFDTSPQGGTRVVVTAPLRVRS